MSILNATKAAMARSWGDEKVDWTSLDQEKFCVVVDERDQAVYVDFTLLFYEFPYFRTQEDAVEYANTYSAAEIMSMKRIIEELLHG